MKAFVLKRKSRMARLGETVERLSEAVTYAEAGSHDHALQVVEQQVEERQKIVVLGRGHAFSTVLMDYAVGLADRMSYEIVAVSAKHIPEDFLSMITSFRDKVRDDFSALAEAAGREFESRARSKNVPFRHVIKFGEGTDVIRALHREFRKLDYVLTEPDENVVSPDGAAPAIPVFSLALNL